MKKKNEILDGNFLIFWFMQGRLTKSSKPLLYHKDWNWLIEVVERIESLSNNPCLQFWVNIGANECTIESECEQYYFNEIEKTKIEATWKCIVTFIKWYNKNKIK